MNTILKLSAEQSEKLGIKTVADLITKLETPVPATAPLEQTSTPSAEVVSAVKTEEASAELVASTAPAVAPEQTAKLTVPTAEDNHAELEAIRKELASFKQTYQVELANAAAKAVADATASLGTAPLSISPANKAVSVQSPEQLIASYNAITDPNEKAKFYEAHKSEIFGR